MIRDFLFSKVSEKQSFKNRENAMIDLAQQKEEMIERQLRNRGIKNEKVLSAMREVPREEFIKKELVEFAYEDAPLPIEEDQTISQPFVVALMADKLELKKYDILLDVGTGSGYNQGTDRKKRV